MSESGNGFTRALGALFWGLNKARVVILNVIFFGLLLLLLVAMMRGPEQILVDEGSALVIAPNGAIVEELAGDPTELALNKMLGSEQLEVLLRDIVDGIEKAKDDERISSILIDTRSFGGASLNKLHMIGEALNDFRESGKPVISIIDNAAQNQYYLAAQADEILLHPEGGVMLEGYGNYPMYYKGMLDKIDADVRLIRVGTYKSAGEPFFRETMSEAAREMNLDFLGDLWAMYLEDVSARRGMTAEELERIVNDFPAILAAAEGNPARAALDSGLVDTLATRHEVRQRMIAITGEDTENHTFHQIDLDSYLAADVVPPGFGMDEGDKVAVVVARGAISDGNQPPGLIGGESTARLLREARHDDNVKSVVLRIDSPGGSVFGSELIRREVMLLREAGKPVVASMSGVAASGGYWIAMEADKIVASPRTITGSIGVFGMYASFAGTIDKIGLNVDGVGTTEMAGSFNPLMPIDERTVDLIQSVINNIYDEFITKVAMAREMTVDEVDAVAQGRVWSGRRAHQLGLIDQLGEFDDALVEAASLANLGDDYKVDYIERELTPFQQFVINLAGDAMVMAGIEFRGYGQLLGASNAQQVIRDLQLLSQSNGKMSVNAYCFCDVR
jgi:protease-4